MFYLLTSCPSLSLRLSIIFPPFIGVVTFSINLSILLSTRKYFTLLSIRISPSLFFNLRGGNKYLCVKVIQYVPYTIYLIHDPPYIYNIAGFKVLRPTFDMRLEF